MSVGDDLREALSKGTGTGKVSESNFTPESFSPGMKRLIYSLDEKGNQVTREMTNREMGRWLKGTVSCMNEHGDFPLIHKNDLKTWLEGHPERKVLEE